VALVCRAIIFAGPARRPAVRISTFTPGGRQEDPGWPAGCRRRMVSRGQGRRAQMQRREGETGEDRAGLVSLGLVMQLVGSVMAAYLIAQSIEPLLDRVFFGNWFPRPGWGGYYNPPYGPEVSSPPPWHLTLLAATGALRALLHRRAGSAILYRHQGAVSPLAVYVVAALAHTGLCVAIFAIDMSSATLLWSATAFIALAWPLCLLAAALRPRFRRALRGDPAAMNPGARDEVATLAIFLGLLGAMISLFALYAAIDSYQQLGLRPVLLIVIASLLCLRAAALLRVGFRGAHRAGEPDESMATSFYVKVGLVTGGLAWMAILLHVNATLRPSGNPYAMFDYVELGRDAMAGYLLFLWPLLLRRLARSRQGMPPATSPSPRSLASLRALGWLLLATGSLQAAFAVVSLVIGESRVAGLWGFLLQFQLFPGAGSRSPWLQLVVAAPQLWVAIELLHDTPRRRAAATVYAAGASVATALCIGTDMGYLIRIIAAGLPAASALVVYLPVAFPLLVPIATLVFVQHHLRRPAEIEPARGGEG